VSISDELARARQLTYAADETSARDLLLSLIPQIEQEDRDDLMLEVLAQLGEIYLARGANDGVQESIQRIDDCLAIYTEVAADANAPMICRYSRRAQFLRTGLAAAQGDHDGAAAALEKLNGATSDRDFADLADEHAHLRTLAQVLCATALCDDDLHARSLPLWEQVLNAVDQSRDGGEFTDHLLVTAATAYGRFCVETGRLSEAEPWLRRAGARAQQCGWELATTRTQLERAAACWLVGDHVSTEQLISQAYPVIERHARAHDLARCWLYLGLTRMASGALEAADECFGHAEQQWRDLGRPLHLHRILLQRSWIPIFWSRFGDAVEMIAEARELLDSSPRSSWLQYAQLDNHLGTVWRADALADLGFDSSGDPDETLEQTEARQAEGLGILHGEVGTPEYFRGLTKLEQAAELKIPAALAVDSVRYAIADADARSRWASRISAPILAGAFAVAWEWENTELISELVEYHSARGTFNAEPQRSPVGEWGSAATAPVLLDAEEALSAAGPAARSGGSSLTRLGPLPPLQMQPDAAPIMSHYRALALQRYGRDVTAAEPAWSTWP
jgi:tetratricopeptide (TPR) repeat protein